MGRLERSRDKYAVVTVGRHKIAWDTNFGFSGSEPQDNNAARRVDALLLESGVTEENIEYIQETGVPTMQKHKNPIYHTTKKPLDRIERTQHFEDMEELLRQAQQLRDIMLEVQRKWAQRLVWLDQPGQHEAEEGCRHISCWAQKETDQAQKGDA